MIHPTAKISDTAWIEPNVTIGQNAQVGDRTRIQAGTVVENDAVIGHDCIVHPNVVIGYDCRIGNEVIIGHGTTIGSEGYGFSQDQNFQSYRIPQTGTVVIEDRVRLGAGNCIDRASYGETRIGAGTKTDNICHFAHGVQIGENCLLTSMFCIAGSSKVGNRVVASGQSGVIDHINICDDVWLLHRAGVVKDIDKPGKYAALPTQPLRNYMRNTAISHELAELKKEIEHLKSELSSRPKA